MIDNDKFTELLSLHKMYKEKELQKLQFLFLIGEVMFKQKDYKYIIGNNADIDNELINDSIALYKKYKTQGNLNKQYAINKDDILSLLKEKRISEDELYPTLTLLLESAITDDRKALDKLTTYAKKINSVIPADFIYEDVSAIEYSFCTCCGLTDNYPLIIKEMDRMKIPVCNRCLDKEIDYRKVSQLYYNLYSHYYKMADTIYD